MSTLCTCKELLISRGIADTRAPSLAHALDVMHSALCHLDSHNMQRFNELFPGVSSACNISVKHDEGLKQLATR